MNAIELFGRMEVDFRLSFCSDNWSEMNFNQYIASQYRERYMGLVADNTETIHYIYTAVFPAQSVINKILADGRREALLFVHHPMQWDITKSSVFTDIPLESLLGLRERKISIYNLHVPLDANGTYGTTWNFAKAVGVRATGEFYEYRGVKAGIIGTVNCETVRNLRQRFEKAVGHSIALYQYGGAYINDNKVALVAGGGNDAQIYPFLREQGINTYLTGIASMRKDYQPSVDAHNAAKAACVNILAGTHYSTEKFACIEMVEYFSQLGIPGSFLSDSPCMEDM